MHEYISNKKYNKINTHTKLLHNDVSVIEHVHLKFFWFSELIKLIILSKDIKEKIFVSISKRHAINRVSLVSPVSIWDHFNFIWIEYVKIYELITN